MGLDLVYLLVSQVVIGNKETNAEYMFACRCLIFLLPKEPISKGGLQDGPCKIICTWSGERRSRNLDSTKQS